MMADKTGCGLSEGQSRRLETPIRSTSRREREDSHRSRTRNRSALRERGCSHGLPRGECRHAASGSNGRQNWPSRSRSRRQHGPSRSCNRSQRDPSRSRRSRQHGPSRSRSRRERDPSRSRSRRQHRLSCSCSPRQRDSSRTGSRRQRRPSRSCSGRQRDPGRSHSRSMRQSRLRKRSQGRASSVKQNAQPEHHDDNQRENSAPRKKRSGTPAFTSKDVIEIINTIKSDFASQPLTSGTVTSKNIDHKNILPNFDPTSKNQRIDIWLRKVNECATVYGWDEKTIVHFAMQKLQGLAKVRYEGLNTILYTWTEWQEKLMSAFPCEQNYGQLLEDMLKRKSKVGGTN